MKIGDLVVRKSYGKDITFKITDIQNTSQGIIYALKGINLRIVADALEGDLEIVSDDITVNEEILNKKVNKSIRGILLKRNLHRGGGDGHKGGGGYRSELRAVKPSFTNELAFGRPGKILHVDGDGEYLDVCLKVYKQLMLDVVGRNIPESEQPKVILELVKQIKPDIVVITGHDSLAKDTRNYTDLNNYKNSRYFVEAVAELRNYESNYDDLVIFAGACQSCYEAILDAGAYYTKLR